jgi:glutathione S-transferase
MTDIKVHSIPGSPYGRAVLIALEEKHARYRLVPVAPQALRSPEHLARHPFGRIPVLEHGEGDYFGGDSPSLADVIIAPQLDFFSATPEWSPLTAKNLHLARWMERMHSRPSMRATVWERVAAMAQAS